MLIPYCRFQLPGPQVADSDQLMLLFVRLSVVSSFINVQVNHFVFDDNNISIPVVATLQEVGEMHLDLGTKRKSL